MDTQQWIMSEGGALIAVESVLQSSWGGICRLTVKLDGATNDYQRVPTKQDYIQSIDLQRGNGLIFGEGPLDTTFWQISDKHFFIVRIVFCEHDFQLDDMMTSLDPFLFDNPDERMRFDFFSSNISVFDSADDGSRGDVYSIDATISPGSYQILTKLHEPNDDTCAIIHRFIKTN